MTKAFSNELRSGAFVAFGVAVVPFAVAAISSAFWALAAGVMTSLLVERGELLAAWQVRGSSRVKA